MDTIGDLPRCQACLDRWGAAVCAWLTHCDGEHCGQTSECPQPAPEDEQVNHDAA